jgi:topoisomerase-4 subunit A
MAKKIDIPKDNNIVKIPIEEAMPENYLPYAVEVAKDRALPDVRDGLKPVHRRIIYGAYMLKAFPDKPYYKSARIVGDILGKYHPHGDSSVYEAMVILAQDFSTRKPLIDGHGNWGSQDGDSAAAMRYTEARMTPLAMEMIRDLDKDVVDMMENYSNSELEPKVLPSRYPNLLVNGTFGIAVGLATNIPPHNLNEVIDGALAFMDNNEITTNELLSYIKGPDLPTGGIIIGKNSLISAYETGEGKVTLRSKAYIEKLENGRLGIVITEFPYRRSKAKLLQTISEMTDDKRHAKALEAITDIRDESDRNGIRAVIELKKAIDMEGAEKLLKYLYKKTDLQCNISFNMVALANGKPETMGLKTMLKHYVNHQREVVTRRTQKELQIAEKRFHIVEGFIKAIDILDEIIALIRASKSKKDSESNLMNTFGFSEIQAQAIVELMLYRLTGLEIKAFEKEHRELEKEIKRLRKILDNEKELLRVIKTELIEIKAKFGDQEEQH